jgi:uncharacterized protein (UPF0147 family)
MLLKASRQTIRRLIFLLALPWFAVSAFAGDDGWITLKAPRFGIVSQLSEEATRAWAEEFNQFVTALHQLYNREDRNLVPLTIVIFKSKKQFSDYRIPTKSGHAKRVVGLFANRDDWSVIALPGLRGYQKTRRVILHEAVHWYSHSQSVDLPLWLDEGLAEVYSTFEVKYGKAYWGMPIQSHINYLDYKGLQPTREFLCATQDEALDELDTYYPQAWAMVHYFLFGNRGQNRNMFNAFLSELSKKSREKAFESALGMTYEEFDRELRPYMRHGKCAIGEMELTDTHAEMEVGPASDTVVQFALGRLAVGVRNYDKGIQHANAVISMLPSRPEGYDLLAMAYRNPEHKTRQLEALEKAISLHSIDPQTYCMRAAILWEENWKEGGMLDKALDKDVAKRIADMYKKSILLRPKKKAAFEGFALALLNSETYEEEDRQLLELGRHFYPQEGSILVGLAALARMDEDMDSFNRNLEESYRDSMGLSLDKKLALRGMQQYTYHEWLFEELQPLMEQGRFEEAEAVLEQQGSLSFVSSDLQKVLDNVNEMLYSSKRLYNADLAIRARKYDEAIAILEDIQKDEKIPRLGKNAAQHMLSRIKEMKEYYD